MSWDPRWQIDDYAYLRPMCLAWADEGELDAAKLVGEMCEWTLLGKFDHEGAPTSDGRRGPGVGIAERSEGLTDIVCFQPGKVIEQDVKLLLRGAGGRYVGALSMAPFVVITASAVRRYASESKLPLPSWWSTDELPYAALTPPDETILAPSRGRPSEIPKILNELRRRAQEGSILPTQMEEMRELHRWFTSQNPNNKYTPKLGTLRRKLGPEYRALNPAPK
jgi:hypothetical protein